MCLGQGSCGTGLPRRIKNEGKLLKINQMFSCRENVNIRQHTKQEVEIGQPPACCSHISTTKQKNMAQPHPFPTKLHGEKCEPRNKNLPQDSFHLAWNAIKLQPLISLIFILPFTIFHIQTTRYTARKKSTSCRKNRRAFFMHAPDSFFVCRALCLFFLFLLGQPAELLLVPIFQPEMLCLISNLRPVIRTFCFTPICLIHFHHEQKMCV